jgi:hypothetical protein
VAEVHTWLRRRGSWRFGLAFVIAILTSLLSAVTAHATCALTDTTLGKYPGPSTNLWAYSAWNNTSHWLQLETQDDSNFDGINYCADAWWDWHFQEFDSGGGSWYNHHHDARLARTCQDGGSYRWAYSNSGFTEAPLSPASAYRYREPQRLGSCKSTHDSSHSLSGGCNDAACADAPIKGGGGYSSVLPDTPNTSTEAWTRNADGSEGHSSGGDPLDAYA